MALTHKKPTEYHNPCIVEVDSGSDNAAKQSGTSCSGVLLGSAGYVLTHSTAIMQCLHQDAHLYETLLKKHSLSSQHFEALNVRVILEKVDCRTVVKATDRTMNNFNVEASDASYKTTDLGHLQNNTSEILSQDSSGRNINRTERHDAGIVFVWKVESFSNALKKLMPKSDGWKFYDYQDSEQTSENSEEAKTCTESQINRNDDIDPDKVNDLLPFFVLLRIKDSSCVEHSHTTAADCSHLKRGWKALIVGSPFGNLSPDVFMNSASQGIISNVSGHNHSLLLTDARCISGCEGGPLYVESKRNKYSLAGLIVAPLCWKQNEWIGLALACSFMEIIRSLHQTFYPRNSVLEAGLDLVNNGITKHQSESCDRAVYVKYGSTWGTGILIDQVKGILITCSHVVKFNRKGTAKIGVVRKGHMKWLVADILYAVPQSQVLDIAILKLTTEFPWPLPPLRIADTVMEGDAVCLTGHALFEADHTPNPSLTKGIISKILKIKNIPVALQTTCAVHAGASGGPVVNEEGELVAMVTCNAKDSTSGAQFPHINLSIPLYVIWPLVQKFLTTDDSSLLEKLHIKDSRLKSLWQMQSPGLEEKHQSKL